MESTLTIGKTIATDTFVPHRPITFTSSFNIEALQDLFGSSKDEDDVYTALADVYKSMLKNAIGEFMKNRTADNCIITLKRKSEVKSKFVNEPVPGVEFDLKDTDKLTIKK